MKTTISWHGGSHVVDSAEAMEEYLDLITKKIDPDLPQVITVQRENGDILSVLLGAEESFLNFSSASADPPYFSSVGDPQAEGLFAFYVDGDHYSEAERRHLIDSSVARNAVREFVQQTDGLPKGVSWEQD